MRIHFTKKYKSDVKWYMEKINRLSLYVLNAAKYHRLVAGKSAYQFSLDLRKSRNYVSQIENVNEDNQYNSADYPSIAEEAECELDDIMPPNNWHTSDSHEKVDKEVVSLSDPVFVKKVLEGIKTSRHAEKLRDLNELYQHLSTKDVKEREVIKGVWEGYSKTNT